MGREEKKKEKKNENLGEKGRGRNPKRSAEKVKQRGKYHKQNLEKEFDVQEILNFHAATLTAAKYGTKSIGDFFVLDTIESKNVQIPFHHQFISLFSKDRFYLLNSCICIDIEKAQVSIVKVTDFYTPTNIISSDETMIACRQRGAPHYIFIPNKPHSHGILFTSGADSNGIVIGFIIRNRTEKIMLNLPSYKRRASQNNFTRSEHEKISEPKKMKELVEGATKNIQESSTIITDKLYSGLGLLESYLERNQHGILKCSSNKPTFLFSSLAIAYLKNQEEV